MSSGNSVSLPALPAAYLGVGQGGVYDAPCLVRTVLGSCVSVTFFAPADGLAAIFHALLPRAEKYREASTVATCFKYVDTAIIAIFDDLRLRGVSRNRIETKVFGGAGLMQGRGFEVGRRNVESAFATLDRLGMRVNASSVGGTMGRTLIFRTDTGEAFVKRINSPLLPAIQK